MWMPVFHPFFKCVSANLLSVYGLSGNIFQLLTVLSNIFQLLTVLRVCDVLKAPRAVVNPKY